MVDAIIDGEDWHKSLVFNHVKSRDAGWFMSVVKRL